MEILCLDDDKGFKRFEKLGVKVVVEEA